MEIKRQIVEEIAKQPYPHLFVSVSGAHLYGFASADSDYDIRGVHILPVHEVVGIEPLKETINYTEFRDNLEIDLVTHDLKKFFTMMLKRNGYVLEQLFSPLIIHTTPEHKELKSLAQGCITRHHAHHYFGFASTQWNLFEKEKIPLVKPLLYVFRVLLTGIHLMQTGKIEANLVNLNQEFKLSYLDELLQIKISGAEKVRLPKTDFSFYRSEYERLVLQLKEAASITNLPQEPTVKPQLNDLLTRIRLATFETLLQSRH